MVEVEDIPVQIFQRELSQTPGHHCEGLNNLCAECFELVVCRLDINELALEHGTSLSKLLLEQCIRIVRQTLQIRIKGFDAEFSDHIRRA